MSRANRESRTRMFQKQVSRKEARKLDRIGCKKRKAEFFSAPHRDLKRRADKEPSDSTSKVMEPQKTSSQKRDKFPDNPTFPSESHNDRDGDAYIAYLETKLGYKGGKKSKRSLDDDGLEDLLDLASSIIPSRQVESGSPVEPSDAENESDDEAVNDGDGSSSSADAGVTDNEASFDSHMLPQSENNAPKNDKTSSNDTVKLQRQLKGLLNRVSEQNMAVILDNVEEVYRNHRRHDVTSTLTTLIIDGISSHSSLLDSYVVLYAAFVSSLHKLIGVEFAAHFVQITIATYECHYKKAIQNEEEELTEGNGKECSNLIVLISELYNFQVISSILVYDIIRGLLDGNVTEFNAELLLKIVRNSGQQLRQDDPSALKDIIQIVQTKLSGQDGILSSRTRFMVETLINLKNNKLKRNITQNQGGDAVERMKKFLSGLSKKKHVLAHEALRVSLEDLHSTDCKGKWWLVGAAWGGDPLLDRRDATIQTEGDTSNDQDSSSLLKLAKKQGMNTDIRRSIFVVLMSSDDFVDACERLAQLNLTQVQQREIVRIILHCCGTEKLYNPYYTLVGQRLCQTSHSYKITLQFCLWDFFRELGETKVGGMEVIKNAKDDGDVVSTKKISSTRIKNVANAYAWWIAKDCSSLAILKPVDFTVLKPQTSEFLKELFIRLFTDSQTPAPAIGSHEGILTNRDRSAIEEIFIKVLKIEGLAMGIIYFLSRTFRGNEGSEVVKWACEVAMETLRTV